MLDRHYLSFVRVGKKNIPILDHKCMKKIINDFVSIKQL
jgi:hypothetical protein